MSRSNESLAMRWIFRYLCIVAQAGHTKLLSLVNRCQALIVLYVSTGVESNQLECFVESTVASVAVDFSYVFYF